MKRKINNGLPSNCIEDSMNRVSDFCTSTTSCWSDEKHATVLNKKCPKCGGDLEVDTTMVLTTYPPKYSCKCRECGDVTYYFCREINWAYDTIGDTPTYPIQRDIKPSDIQPDKNDFTNILDELNKPLMDTLPDVHEIPPSITINAPDNYKKDVTVIGGTTIGECKHLYDVKVSGGKVITYCVKCGKIGEVQDQFGGYNITCTTVPTIK